jgi:hypothetical protein
MRPWRETLKTTVIITLGAIFILVGILVWAFLFFRTTSSIHSRKLFEVSSRATSPHRFGEACMVSWAGTKHYST